MKTPDRTGEIDAALAAVRAWTPEGVTHHATQCCDAAVAWFVAMARTRMHESSAPGWIRDRWKWGPQPRPTSWCQLVSLGTIDCGGLAFLAATAWASQGQRVRHVQLLTQFNETAVRHWRRTFEPCPGSLEWTWGTVAYHEAVSIERRGVTQVWDPTDRVVLDGVPARGYGAVVAIRFGPLVGSASGWNHDIRWRGKGVVPERWTRLAPPDCSIAETDMRAVS